MKIRLKNIQDGTPVSIYPEDKLYEEFILHEHVENSLLKVPLMCPVDVDTLVFIVIGNKKPVKTQIKNFINVLGDNGLLL